MDGLQVTFGGLQLKNPVIMASAPPTESVETISRCAEAGAAAAITKTMADFDAPSFTHGARRAGRAGRGLWALSTFRRETLTLDEGAQLVEDSVRETGIPIIASVGALGLDTQSWLTACRAAETSGASLIQLDLFYLPQPRCSPENAARLLGLLQDLSRALSIPVMPKLNVDLPAHFAAELLRDSCVTGAILMDSIRTPPPIDVQKAGHLRTPYVEGAGECSLFGPWQKPLTLQYTAVLASQTDLELMAGGGLMDGKDAAEAIMLGATTVQFATAIIRHGYRRIGRILRELEQVLDINGYGSIAEMRGQALAAMAMDEQSIGFLDARAVVDSDLCTMCGVCTELVFCPDILLSQGGVEVLPHCEGCGLCVSLCPEPGALTLQSVGRE